jgi:hypothetical protein
VDALRVRRTGGFLGAAAEGVLDLASDDPAAARARELVEQVDPAAVHHSEPRPDRYRYLVDGPGLHVEVHEQDLTPALAELVDLVLGEG